MWGDDVVIAHCIEVISYRFFKLLLSFLRLLCVDLHQ